MPEILVAPDGMRAGVGLMPTSERGRGSLPQESHFCPVLEDGSRLGFLVYPPLKEDETYSVSYDDDAVYEFTFNRGGRLAFVITEKPAAGGGGTGNRKLKFYNEHAGVERAEIHGLVDSLINNVHSPDGGVGLRGAYHFFTPEGWDTVYTGVMNELRVPAVPCLTIRVQTDWYLHATEFRYVLQKGDSISASAHAPVGQVFFVPREAVTLSPVSRQETTRRLKEKSDYLGRKPQLAQHTNYGAYYDNQYRTESRERRRALEARASDQPPEEEASPARHPSDRAVQELLRSRKKRKKRK